MRIRSKAVAGIIAAAAVLLGVAAPASAAPISQQAVLASSASESIVISVDDFDAVEDAAENAGPDAEVYTLDSGSVVVVGEPLEGPGLGRIQVTVGWNVYIYLNKTDQAALLAGAGAGVAAAICAIPAVGTGSCAAVVIVVAAATVYVTEYGTCPSSKPQLELTLGVDGNIKCTTGPA